MSEAEQGGGAPTLGDARRAADVLIREGATKVLLFGSVARGEATFGSDLDFLAVLDDLGDYSDRRRVWARMSGALERMGLVHHCDVLVTDRPELDHLLRNVETSFYASAASHGKVLADIGPQVPINWDKEMMVPENRTEQAEESLRGAVGKLNQMARTAEAPSMTESRAEESEDALAYQMERIQRTREVLGDAHLCFEMCIKSLTHLFAKKTPSTKHSTERLIKNLPEQQRGDIEGIMGDVRHNDIQFWHILRNYASAEVPSDVPPPSEELAVRLSNVACDALLYTAGCLEEQGGNSTLVETVRWAAEKQAIAMNSR